MPQLTSKQLFRRAKAEIVDTLTRRSRWQFPELRTVVERICNRWDVDYYEMMHALGLA